MVKGQPVLGLPLSSTVTRFEIKSLLGILFLAFFLGILPSTNLQTKVFAQSSTPSTETPKTPETISPTFQLPHPGYLTTHFSNWHPGIDIATGFGMPIHPIASGTVVDAGFNFWGLGLVVTVDNGSGFQSLYAHMGRIFVKKGQSVATTDILGEVGMTGNTSGPHTHLQISKDGHNIDPQPLLPPLRQTPRPEDLTPVAPESTPSGTVITIENAEIASPSAAAEFIPSPSPTPIPTPPPILMDMKPNDLNEAIKTFVPIKNSDPVTEKLDLNQKTASSGAIIAQVKQNSTLTFPHSKSPVTELGSIINSFSSPIQNLNQLPNILITIPPKNEKQIPQKTDDNLSLSNILNQSTSQAGKSTPQKTLSLNLL